MISFSIIIPACNEEKYIIRTLESVKNQNYKNYELIVVCNGCKDKTYEKTLQFLTQNKFKNYKVIELTQGSVTKAKNFGAKLATKEFLLFLDSDTFFETNNFLTQLNNKLNKNKKIIGTCRIKSDSGIIEGKIYSLAKNIYSNKYTKGINALLFTPRKEFYKTGMFDENLKKREFYYLFKNLQAKRIDLEFASYKDLTVVHSVRRIEKMGLLTLIFFWFIKSFFVNDYKIIR